MSRWSGRHVPEWRVEERDVSQSVSDIAAARIEAAQVLQAQREAATLQRLYPHLNFTTIRAVLDAVSPQPEYEQALRALQSATDLDELVPEIYRLRCAEWLARLRSEDVQP